MESGEVYRDNLKSFKNADMVLNFSYLAIKLSNFKSVDEKLSKMEPRVSHSFDIKIVSRKKLLKVLASLQAYFRWNFLFQNLIITIFNAVLKFYLWSTCIHMANNLILAISCGFQLNSNLNRPILISRKCLLIHFNNFF